MRSSVYNISEMRIIWYHVRYIYMHTALLSNQLLQVYINEIIYFEHQLKFKYSLKLDIKIKKLNTKQDVNQHNYLDVRELNLDIYKTKNRKLMNKLPQKDSACMGIIKVRGTTQSWAVKVFAKIFNIYIYATSDSAVMGQRRGINIFRC